MKKSTEAISELWVDDDVIYGHTFLGHIILSALRDPLQPCLALPLTLSYNAVFADHSAHLKSRVFLCSARSHGSHILSLLSSSLISCSNSHHHHNTILKLPYPIPGILWWLSRARLDRYCRRCIFGCAASHALPSGQHPRGMTCKW